MHDFEKLERINCQIDVWIDEEEYDKINKVLVGHPTWDSKLTNAFLNATCTFNKDQEWFDLLNGSTEPPIRAVKITKKDEIKLIDKRDWSFFFGAKLIRSKIQQKGTDCYLQRLDQVINYLEQRLPIISSNNLQSNKLAVIYLLEMAACGVETDHRSFAERVRRILKNIKYFPADEKHFIDFYELLARYNIGIGHFHEGSYQKSVEEFNFIIDNWNKAKERDFAEFRFVEDLIYVPSILYRADIQLKLQLSYHALGTIVRLDKRNKLSIYKEVQKQLIMAEAHQLMGQQKQVWKSLNKVGKALCIQMADNKNVTIVKAVPGEKLFNVKERFQVQLADVYLQYLKEDSSISSNYFINLGEFRKEYKKSIINHKYKRRGYFEQIAEQLDWFSNKEKYVEEAKKIFEENKEIVKKDKRCDCPCNEKGIDLERLDSDHYNEFYKHLLIFFKRLGSYKIDEDRFIKRLRLLEKDKYNLCWRMRELESTQLSDPCSKCLTNKKPFQRLLECATPRSTNKRKFEETDLNTEDYNHIMNHWDDYHFLRYLEDYSIHTPSEQAIHFLGLQRWDSSSPAQGRSIGGGYLIYHTKANGQLDLGVAIDPGFDFLRNLFHCGFSLADIDVVLLSHAHLDHVRDFESMVTLLFELSKRTKTKRGKHRLHAILTLSVYKRLEYIFESPSLREFIEPYIVDVEKEITKDFLGQPFIFIPEEKNKNNTRRFIPILSEKVWDHNLQLKIIPMKAYHNDHSNVSDSFGFIIEIKDQHVNYKIGYTGDTSWNQDVMGQYKGCNALLVHLGSIVDREDLTKRDLEYYDNGRKCFELIQRKNHPYLMGLFRFFTEIRTDSDWQPKPLVLLGEFGEEMRGKIRVDLTHRLKDAYGFHVLPVDVGLDVLLKQKGKDEGPKVFCAQCGEPVSLDRAGFESYGYDEALFCICSTCNKSTPHSVLQERLRELYEEGISIRVDKETVNNQ